MNAGADQRAVSGCCVSLQEVRLLCDFEGSHMRRLAPRLPRTKSLRWYSVYVSVHQAPTSLGRASQAAMLHVRRSAGLCAILVSGSYTAQEIVVHG